MLPYADSHVHWDIENLAGLPQAHPNFINGDLKEVVGVFNGNYPRIQKQIKAFSEYFSDQKKYIFPGFWAVDDSQKSKQKLGRFIRNVAYLQEHGVDIAGIKYHCPRMDSPGNFEDERYTLTRLSDFADRQNIPIILAHIKFRDFYAYAGELKQEVVVAHFGEFDGVGSGVAYRIEAEESRKKSCDRTLSELSKDGLKENRRQQLEERLKRIDERSEDYPELPKKEEVENLWFDISAGQFADKVKKDVVNTARHLEIDPTRFASRIIHGSDLIYLNGTLYLCGNDSYKLDLYKTHTVSGTSPIYEEWPSIRPFMQEGTTKIRLVGVVDSRTDERMMQSLDGRFKEFEISCLESVEESQKGGIRNIINKLGSDPLTAGIPMENFHELIRIAEKKAGRQLFVE